MKIKHNWCLAPIRHQFGWGCLAPITPIWRDDMDKETKSGQFSDVTRLIVEIASSRPSVHLIDELEISLHNPDCYSDGFLHPNTAGFTYMASRLYRKMIRQNIIQAFTNDRPFRQPVSE